MNDEQARDKLIDLLYGELDESEAAELMEKVRSDPALAGELARLRGARRALAAYRTGEPAAAPGGWLARLGPARVVRLRRAFGAAAAVAAAVVIAVAAWMLFEGTGPVAIAGPVEIKRLNVSLTILSEPEEWPRYYYAPQQQAEQMARPRPLGRGPILRGWPGLALVRDQRLIANLKKGVSEVRFTDVPAGILPDTVRLRSLDDPDALTILEQNYQYDLASAAAVLDKHVDKPIAVVFKDGGQAEGTLLSFDDASLVVRPGGEGPRTISRQQVKALRLAELPEGLLTTPTLLWHLRNQAAARQQFEVAYMTHGLKWRADYVLKLHPARAGGEGGEIVDTADLVGYATVTNDSGVTYQDAQLKLMAGDVNLIRPPEALRLWGGGVDALRTAGQAGAYQFKEKAFFEYHLYTLGRPTTLRSAETKQIELVTGAGLKLRRKYVYDRNVHATAARVVSEFKNSEADGLGKPLPKGVVRLFAPDPDPDPQRNLGHLYAAQTRIDHTPRDETIRLGWGYAFDIACEATRTQRTRLGASGWREAWRYELRNHKDHDVTVTVVVRVPSATYEFKCPRPWRLEKVGWIEMDVPVKANSAEKLTFSYAYDYRSGGGLKPQPRQ